MFLLQKLWNKADDFYQTKQIEYFLSWIKHENCVSGETVFINLPLQEEFLECSTGKNKKKSDKDIFFVICEPRNLRSSLEKIKVEYEEESWALIFRSLRIEIWENKKHHKKFLPLRFGLDKSEKLAALKLARSSMEAFLNSNNSESYKSHFNIRFDQNATVDVAVWVGGSLRGSIIIENKPLHSAIEEASRRAIRDGRFKPVTKEELTTAIIEITIMSDLKIPISSAEISNGFLDGRKGYYVFHDEKRGWYLPTVFNCMRFKGMEDFLKSLSQEKAKIPSQSFGNVESSSFLVQGFVEYNDDELDLDGPVATLPKKHSEFNLDFKNILLKHCDETAGWLTRLQDEDGFLPVYVDPIYHKFGNMDWTRLAFTTYALAYYGKCTDNKDLLVVAEKSFLYLSEYIKEIFQLRPNISASTLVYMAETALIFENREWLEKTVTQIEKSLHDSTYEPILYSTSATFFIKYSQNVDKKYLDKALELAETVWDDFEKRKNNKSLSLELAKYPELINTLSILFKQTKDEKYMQKSLQITNWLKSGQLSSGAFSQYPGSSFCYTRGSGKIFESFSVNPEDNRESIIAVFNWMMSMKYGEHNTYFVKNIFKEQIIGGFRHDYINSEAWIDASAHFIIGGARLIKYIDRH